MEVNKGLLAFFAEEEVAVGVVVHEEVFGEDGGAGGVAEEVEVFLEVGVGVDPRRSRGRDEVGTCSDGTKPNLPYRHFVISI